jgi:PAS domain S-box-containing protein
MSTILIVDDRPANRDFLVTLLGYSGHRLLEAADGAEGLAVVRAERPDLVIADILMPTMDGYEFVRQLRADPAVADTRVVFYTAQYHEPEARRLADACGVSDVLTKPCEPEVVLRTVEAALGHAPPPPPASAPAANEFDREHLHLLTDKLSQQTDELRRTNERLTAIVELGQQLQVFCNAAREIVGARYAVVGIPNGADSPYRHFLTSGMDVATAARVGRPGPLAGVLGSVLAAGRCFRAANLSGLDVAGLPPSFPPALTILAAPVLSPTHVHGWVCLLDKLGADAFTDEDERLARMLAAQVGRIYENGSLYADLLRHSTKLAEEVAERKRSEASLRESEERFRAAFDYTAVAMALTDVDNRFVRVNAAFARMFGYSPPEMLALTMAGVTHPDDCAESYARRDLLLAGEGHFFQMEKRYLHRDGHTFWGLTNVSLVRDPDGRPLLYVGQIQDITERKRAEEGLRLFRALIDQTMDGIEVIDPETGRYLDINERTSVTHGYTREEYLSLSVPDVDTQVASRPWGELIAERRLARVQAFESQHRRKDGSTFPVEVNLNFIRLDRDYVVAVVRDITERKQLEEQFRQAQKMEAVGRLAGGVAHDFNNLLQVIMGYGALLLETLQPDDPSRELVGEMTQAGERATGLTRQLLAFSRQSVLAPRVLVLNSVVIDVEKMLRRVIGEDIDLTTSLQPGLGRVKADPGQIEQVVMNLAVNARDAMPQGGKLTIETRDAELHEEYTRLHVGVRPGPYVLLAVSDTGHGMTPEVQARIFEPFFTTKEQGKGTGLGLATVFDIVQQAGGHVTAYSEPGMGTTFKVYLPRVEESVSPAKSRSGVLAAPKGTETVLLVEDEDAVRSLIRIVLQGAGYRVLEASDGGEAVAVAGRHEGPIHLLLSDVVMPVLGGRELAERLLTLHPEMKVLFQSGYTDDAVVRHGVLQEKVHFLQKPYSPAALAWKVREVLDAPQ